MSITVCVSHKEDVDGISSAILINSVFKNVNIILVDYAHLINQLTKLLSSLQPVNKGYNRIFICDLGLNKKNQKKFIHILNKIIQLGYKIYYIDHHDIDSSIKKEIKDVGVHFMHSIEECTSVQVFNKYKHKLHPSYSFFAASGALTDYMENKPIASSIVSRYDRQFLMLESTAFSYMISSHQNDDDYLRYLVEKLSIVKYPHDIEGGFIAAEKYAKKISFAIDSIEKNIIYKSNLSMVQNTLNLASSTVVNFVLGMSGKKVAIVYKYKEDKGLYIISIRGSRDCEIHLGRLVNDIASTHGGSGGGHDKACGAVIPRNKFSAFINYLDEHIK
ncbi:MAG: DHHA1 domain-containing protein [Nitrososphaeraceae archaeon]